MLSTRELLQALRSANPRSKLTEDHIRYHLRRGTIPSPTTFAGRLAWSEHEAQALAGALGLHLQLVSEEVPHEPS